MFYEVAFYLYGHLVWISCYDTKPTEAKAISDYKAEKPDGPEFDEIKITRIGHRQNVSSNFNT